MTYRQIKIRGVYACWLTKATKMGSRNFPPSHLFDVEQHCKFSGRIILYTVFTVVGVA